MARNVHRTLQAPSAMGIIWQLYDDAYPTQRFYTWLASATRFEPFGQSRNALDASAHPKYSHVHADELVGVEHVSSIHAHNGVGMALFGYPNGKVGFVNMQKSMDHANSTRQIVPFTCSTNDSHNAPVFSVAWETGVGKKDEVKYAVSVGLDGLLKVWETNRNTLALLWTSPPVVDAPYSLVSPALMDHGIVACALSTGSLVVWTKLKAVLPRFLRPVVSFEAPQRIDIPCPKMAPNSNAATISKITVDPTSSNQTVHLLVAYHAQSCFHRVSIDQVTRDVVITAFGDDPGLGLISCVEPLFVDVNDVDSARSFVAVGDTLGCINIYDWSSRSVVEADYLPAITSPIRPVRKIEAHADGGSVTAISWNETVLVSGSDTGEVKVWDGVNLEFVREFGPRSRGRSERSSEDIVGQISLVGDSQAVIFNVGSRIVGWWAGPAKRNIRGGVRSRHIAGSSKKKTGRASKVHDTHDLHSAISESRDLIRDSSTLPEGVFERKQNELSQRLGLESLGLSEVEAVEYVLMLSREEHETAQTGIEEGVFDADFDLDGSGPVPSSSNQRSLSPSPPPSETTISSGASSRASSRRSSFHSSPQASRSFTRASPSSVNTKLQLSARQPEEPKEAAPTHFGRPIDRPAKSKAKGVDHSEKHFPNMPKSTSPTSPSLSKRSISASSVSPPSAWCTPLAMTKSSSSSHAKTSPSKGDQGKQKATAKNSNMDDMDDDLRFAIELSMAEAVSRGDVLRD
ncbi:hypothetical protein ONZ45_g5762 [Pleurotus djamor]|nr:hypothetical protein ONZ45_g5762 [Pleurotus djamor]